MNPLVCNLCGKLIKDVGIINEGRPYHPSCFDEEKAQNQQSWQDTITSLVAGINEATYDALINNYDDLDSLLRDLKAPWAVIHEMFDCVEIETFKTKVKMTDWVIKHTLESMSEDYIFNVLHILRKGKDRTWRLRLSVR